jgi:RNA polymerase sigma-70 factor (ECF subfamily)
MGRAMSSHVTIAMPMNAGTRQASPGAIQAPAASSRPESDLVARLRSGDRAAEEGLYREHVDAVMGMAIRLLGRTCDAEDVVHDSFVTAFEHIGQLRDASSFRAWLLRVTVRHAHRRFRRRRLLQRLGFDSGQDDATLAQLAAPGLSSDAIAELAKIDRVLAELPASQRSAWLLRRVEGLELAEVAAACGASISAVKRRIAAAQARVDHHLGLAVDDD